MIYNTDGGFLGKDVKPAQGNAVALVASLLALLKADADLINAKDDVPSYTAQYEDADYYAREQEAFNRATDDFYATHMAADYRKEEHRADDA